MVTKILMGTPQIPDYLIYNGEKIPIFSNPIESYLELKEMKNIDRGCNSSACWRGYIAIWKLENGQLSFEKVEKCGILQSVGVYTGLECEQSVSSEIINYIEKEINLKEAHAKWFTGRLIAPKGRMIEYIHMGYESVFEEESHYIIEKGVLKKIETIKNMVKPELYDQYNQTLIRDTLLSNISKLNWKYLEEELLCEDFYLISINKKGRVSKVKYESLLDSKKEDFMYHLTNMKCLRHIRKSVKKLRFKKYLKGQPQKIEIKLELISMN